MGQFTGPGSVGVGDRVNALFDDDAHFYPATVLRASGGGFDLRFNLQCSRFGLAV